MYPHKITAYLPLKPNFVLHYLAFHILHYIIQVPLNEDIQKHLRHKCLERDLSKCIRDLYRVSSPLDLYDSHASGKPPSDTVFLPYFPYSPLPIL